MMPSTYDQWKTTPPQDGEHFDCLCAPDGCDGIAEMPGLACRGCLDSTGRFCSEHGNDLDYDPPTEASDVWDGKGQP
jgi:hypothetical protein